MPFSSRFLRALFVTLFLGIPILAGVYRFLGAGGFAPPPDPAALARQAELAFDAVKRRRPDDRRPASYDAVLAPLDGLLELARNTVHSPDYDPVNDYDKVAAAANPVVTIAAAAHDQAQTETGPLKKAYRFNAQKAEACMYIASAMWSRMTARGAGGERRMDAASYPEAEMNAVRQTLDAGIEADPGNRRLWYMRGAVNRAGGMFAAAAKDLEQALALDADDAEAWNALGLVYIDLKQFDRAEETLERAKAVAVQAAEAAGTKPGEAYTTIIFNLARYHEGLAAFYARENRLGPSPENLRLRQSHSARARAYLEEFIGREDPDSPDSRLAGRLLEGLPG